MVAAELRGSSKPNLSEALGWIGSRVDDIYGASVGRLEDVWIDPGTGVPRWLLVKEDRLGSRTTLIPFEDATAGAGHVWVPYAREVVREAPEIESGAPLTQQVESSLRTHYAANSPAGISQRGGEGPAALGAAGPESGTGAATIRFGADSPEADAPETAPVDARENASPRDPQSPGEPGAPGGQAPVAVPSASRQAPAEPRRPVDRPAPPIAAPGRDHPQGAPAGASDRAQAPPAGDDRQPASGGYEYAQPQGHQPSQPQQRWSQQPQRPAPPQQPAPQQQWQQQPVPQQQWPQQPVPQQWPQQPAPQQQPVRQQQPAPQQRPPQQQWPQQPPAPWRQSPAPQQPPPWSELPQQAPQQPLAQPPQARSREPWGPPPQPDPAQAPIDALMGIAAAGGTHYVEIELSGELTIRGELRAVRVAPRGGAPRR